MAVAVAFLLIGVLGFVPGVTSDYGAMEFAGHESGALLLGLFQVSILHNIVHLLYGVAGLVLFLGLVLHYTVALVGLGFVVAVTVGWARESVKDYRREVAHAVEELFRLVALPGSLYARLHAIRLYSIRGRSPSSI